MSRTRWTLQRRLILTIASIVSLILVTVAVATSAILVSVLEARLDDQLASVRDRTVLLVGSVVRSDPTADASALLADLPGAQEGFLLAVATTTTTSGAYVDDGGNIRSLSPTQLVEIDRALTGPGMHTISIEGTDGFRIEARGTGVANVVVGLSRADVLSTLAQMLTVIALLTAGGLVLLIAATAWTVRAGLRPLRSVAETAARVAEIPLDQGVVTISERVPDDQSDSRTEVGQVGAALNTLLDHVDASLHSRQRNEERMRRFVADASHELRTPLASIRGYSELSLRALDREDASAHAIEMPMGTQQSLERIHAQSLRMSSLVEDLLLLARLDEGRELVYGAVDLSRLMVEAVQDARAAAPDHEWRIDVPATPVTFAGDAPRLQQVIANLLANARAHTPPGTVVTGIVAQDGDTGVLRVHDDGPGVDPAIRDELFERFARADRSRARQTGGSGLGLSIARAIVTAHGGTIEVDSRPGDTTFTVRLPLTPAQD